MDSRLPAKSQIGPPDPANGPTSAVPPTRKVRSDGEISRKAIVRAAADLATTRGFDGLSLSELAERIGMSKSGLFAHFGSKEELELATVEAAEEIFDNDVVREAMQVEAGLARLLKINDAFLSHIERRVFPGGCFFATVAVQMAFRPGRVRDRLLQVHTRWFGLLGECLQDAKARGQLPADVDVGQLVFEITAMMNRANVGWIVTGDPEVIRCAKVGVKHVLERAGAK